MALKHAKTSAKSDGADATLVQPSDWNAGHTLDTGAGTTDGDLSYSTSLEAVLAGDGTRARGVASLGWALTAYHHPINASGSFGTAVSLAAVAASLGGAVAVPMYVPAHMLLQSVMVRSTNTTLLRTAEWRLYLQPQHTSTSGEATVNEIAGANGTWSFTAAAASNQTSGAAASAPVYLAPGMYVLAIRNTSTAQTFDIGTSGVTLAPNIAWTRLTAAQAALGSTLDLSAFTASGVTFGVALLGRKPGGTTVL